VYIVSHDLKSPLSSIIMMMDLIRSYEEIKNSPSLTRNVDMIHDCATHLSDMIVSILDYSRQSQSQQTIEEVDTHQLVQDIAGVLFMPAHIKVSILGTLPVIHTKKLKLQQVFQNLLTNAMKYSDKAEGLIAVSAEDKGGFIEFQVKDNGPGIATKDYDRVFRLFETTSNQSSHDSSTGMGLNMLKVLVEEQGGKVWVDSVEGQGSSFFFEWKKDAAPVK
jgi:signal transduction histidine kinase